MDKYLATLKSLEKKHKPVPFIYFTDEGLTAAIANDVRVGKNLLYLAESIEKTGLTTVRRLLYDDLSDQPVDQVIKTFASNVKHCNGSHLNYEIYRLGHPHFDVTKTDIWTITRFEKMIL